MKKLFSSRILAIGLFVSLITSISISSTFADTTPKGKPFIAINDQIVEVEGAVSSLQDQIELLVGRVDTVEGRLIADAAAIATLQEQNAILDALLQAGLTDLATIQAEILSLQQTNTELETMIVNNSDDIAALQVDIDANSALITTLQSSVLMLENNIITIDSDMTVLQSQVDNNLNLIAILQTEIDMIKEDIAYKQDIIDGICPDSQAIGQINPDGSVVCHDPDSSNTITAYRVWKFFIVPRGGKAYQWIRCNDGDIPMSVGFKYTSSLVSVRQCYLKSKDGGEANIQGYVYAYNFGASDQSVLNLVRCLKVQ